MEFLCSLVVCCWLLFVRSITAQTTTHLPAAPSYTAGKFTNPDTSIAQIFTNGSQMNVTWKTGFNKVTLWLIYDAQYNNPTLLISGTTDRSFLWTVNDNGNNTRPFSFRAVNTGGTKQAQQHGGFYTGQFWIADSENPGRDSPTTTSSTSPPDSSATPISASALGSDATSTASPSDSTSSQLGPSPSNATAIGVGVGVGVGIALLIIAACAFGYIRRKRSKQATPPFAPSDAHMSYAPSEMTWATSSDPHYSGVKSPQASEMQAPNQPAEAPTIQEPGELEADAPGAQLAGPKEQKKDNPLSEYR